MNTERERERHSVGLSQFCNDFQAVDWFWYCFKCPLHPVDDSSLGLMLCMQARGCMAQGLGFSKFRVFCRV